MVLYSKRNIDIKMRVILAGSLGRGRVIFYVYNVYAQLECINCSYVCVCSYTVVYILQAWSVFRGFREKVNIHPPRTTFWFREFEQISSSLSFLNLYK